MRKSNWLNEQCKSNYIKKVNGLLKIDSYYYSEKSFRIFYESYGAHQYTIYSDVVIII